MKKNNLTVINFFVFVFGLILMAGCGGQNQNSDTAQMGSENEDSEGSGFESIFNGQNLDNWDGDPRFWSVENGTIVGETSDEMQPEANTFLIWQGGDVGNFEATYQYRFVEVGDTLWGNSGLQYRSERFTDEDNPDLKWRVRGHQADFAVSDWIPGIHYEEQGRGILARRGQRVVIDSTGESTTENFATEDSLGQYTIPHTAWHDMRVYANGDTMRSYINGHLMHELIDHAPESRKEGILAIQLHRGSAMRIEIRNIQLRKLD